ncbi:MAG: CIS tube protein [Thermoanaerobaculia bacterium]
MSSFPLSPRLIKGGLVLIDPLTSAVQRVIALQYNPERLTRSLQMQATGESGNRTEPLRIKAPPIETLRIEADIDATDQLERPDENRAAVESGILPQLAALEAIVYPGSTRMIVNAALAMVGTLEIIPIESPLVIFVWSRNRIVPVRITELSITEEAFDPRLNPIRAKVTLALRVLTVDDLGFLHRGGGLYLLYQMQKERLAASLRNAAASALGIGGIP